MRSSFAVSSARPHRLVRHLSDLLRPEPHPFLNISAYRIRDALYYRSSYFHTSTLLTLVVNIAHNAQCTTTQFACSLIPNLSSFDSSNLWTVLGEWSAASTDCAKWLNGRNVGARWDGTYDGSGNALGSCDGLTGNSSTFSDDYKAFLRK